MITLSCLGCDMLSSHSIKFPKKLVEEESSKLLTPALVIAQTTQVITG